MQQASKLHNPSGAIHIKVYLSDISQEVMFLLYTRAPRHYFSWVSVIEKEGMDGNKVKGGFPFLRNLWCFPTHTPSIV